MLILYFHPQLAVSSLLSEAVWWSMEWSAGRLTLQMPWFLMEKMWRSTANILTSSAASPHPRPALMGSCSHQPATWVKNKKKQKTWTTFTGPVLFLSVSACQSEELIDSWWLLLFVFQSPRGCSINCSLTGWSQRLKHASPVMTWKSDLFPSDYKPCHTSSTHRPHQIFSTLQQLYSNYLCYDYSL